MATAVSRIQTTMASDGLRIQELIDRAGINLHELHKQTGISYQTLLRYRDDETVSIKIEHVRLICTVTKRDANALFGIGKPGNLQK